MKFDEILVLLGEFGPYQKRIYFLVGLPAINAGIFMMINVFLLGNPDHRCAIPGCDNDTYAVQSNLHAILINRTIPPPDDDNFKYDECHLFPPNASYYDNYSRPTNASKYKCDKWVYDESVFHENVVTEMSVVCDKEILQSIAKMTFFIGVLFGDLTFGVVADRYGRKKSFYLSILLLLVSTIVLYWVQNFVEYSVVRFFIGAGCAGIFLVGFVIAMEMVGPSKRLWAGTFWQVWFEIGLIILSGVAYLVRDWRKLQIIMAIPTVIYLPYYWLIPESSRWLLSQGRPAEAEAVLRKAARVNKVTLPDDFLDQCEPDNDTGKVWHLFRSRKLAIRTSVIFYNWLAIATVYYGLSLNTGNLGGDFYLNFLLQGVSEFPAYVICLLLFDRLGRKKLLIGFFFLGGLSCIATLFTRIYGGEKLEAATITLAMVGKMCVSGTFTVIYVFSAELYPTVVRNSGVGTSSCFSRFGVISAPYIAGLNTVVNGDLGRALPLVIFGSFSVSAGLLSLHLPETAHARLPETIDDAENFPMYRY
ncbi:organic cation transporter protein-like [Mercenaria mercenaria]|uniref:organic cation transporter protein-like n=1 Tax=Mercenaria mercenaria TaxID=6596 RepID=UPI00234F0E86|nr:organic cation transporter protein-like [Mercenaria mercenaria]